MAKPAAAAPINTRIIVILFFPALIAAVSGDVHLITVNSS
jgi:hypothetical protein